MEPVPVSLLDDRYLPPLLSLLLNIISFISHLGPNAYLYLLIACIFVWVVIKLGSAKLSRLATNETYWAAVGGARGLVVSFITKIALLYLAAASALGVAWDSCCQLDVTARGTGEGTADEGIDEEVWDDECAECA